MNDSELCENIKQNLEAQGIQLSKADVQKLYTSVLDNMSEILDEGNMVHITDFGDFWRKNGEANSSTFFKPDENILERINKER